MIDTHSHIFLPEFDNDRDAVIARAKETGVIKIFMPNVDRETIPAMMDATKKYPDFCLPAMGLHPCSVKENFEKELHIVEEWLGKEKFYAVGETGTDLYWDKTFIEQQKTALAFQINLAKKYRLPMIIHIRNSFDATFEVLEKELSLPAGIFHCFSGNTEHAKRAVEMGFLLGIGGVITFKNSGLEKVVSEINLDKLVLETDAPYLAPIPFRGKRNEPAYLKYIAEKIAEIKKTTVEEVIEATGRNAKELFNV
ncbi:MAG: TatD family hydrolase [Bacteroidetes bacterium]|nr:TatD family hydrolase [Bacteroidota bacterium]